MVEATESSSASKDRNVLTAQPLGRIGLHVCVFCSANELPARYTEPAKEFARLLAEHGHTLVWGGSNVGMMKLVADGAQAGGAKIVGVSVNFLEHVARQNADEMHITKDLGQRKAMMLERSDVIVTLVGGSGTLDELTDIIEHKKHGHHNKPIVVLNTEGFYDGLRIQFDQMETDGFLPGTVADLVTFAETPREAIDYVNDAQET